jgi:hypothetical protein
MDPEKETKETIVAEAQDAPLIPTMNVNMQPAIPTRDVGDLIPDAKLVKVYDEVLDNIRRDRDEIDTVLSTFVNMVINEGDATTSSKEALVNLIKMKADQADKMSKMADLMTRLKMKDPFPKYMAAHQTNNVTIKEAVNKKSMLKQIAKEVKEIKRENT